jgi:hypothetical protein
MPSTQYAYLRSADAEQTSLFSNDQVRVVAGGKQEGGIGQDVGTDHPLEIGEACRQRTADRRQRDRHNIGVARLLEPLAMLWIDQAMKRGRGRDFAFALVNMR